MTSTHKRTVKPTDGTMGRKRSRRCVAKPTRGQPKRRPVQADKAAPISQKNITKRDQLAAMLVRDQGATIDQMRETTGWLPHTVRAALTGLKKLGYAIDSDKVDGLRTSRAVAPE